MFTKYLLKLPLYFSFCGYANALSFKNITNDDIDEVEEVMRKMSYDPALNSRGVLTSNKFTIHRGDRILIEELAAYVKQLVDGNGVNSGLHHFKKIDSSAASKMQKKESDVVRSTNTHFLLNKFIETAQKNSGREKGGYRYDVEIQLLSSYLKMIAGKLAYETLHKNMDGILPSPSTVDRYIESFHSHITEGILRSEELKNYLNDRKIEPVVCLSEDGTRIIGRVQYDSKTNQLVGFVLPLNQKNGMPIPFSYPARSANEILRHFSNNNSTSAYLNVIMAQPIGNAPPFCLLLFGSDNKYTGKDVAKRWGYIKNELEKNNIKVLIISSDSDPKYNSAMRELSGLGNRAKTLHPWFAINDDRRNGTYFVQDLVHLATKLRNFIMNAKLNKKVIPFGNFEINVEHLHQLLLKFSKDKHQLTETTLNPIDKQNFKSVQRMCSNEVINLLRDNIEGSQGTVQYLQIIRDVIDCYMNPNLTPIQRVRKAWYSIFLIRIWREFILSRKEYSLKANFLTPNCYSCIELNAQSLVLCMLHLRKIGKPELFVPNLFGSQPCEAIFRQFRSFTTTYSTVTNCTVKEATSRISKIHFQNQITHITSDNIVYPRSDKRIVSLGKHQLPSEIEILDEIRFCSSHAIRTATGLGLICEKSNNISIYQCNITPNSTKLKPARKRSNETRNSMGGIFLSPRFLQNIKLKNYYEKLIAEKITETSPYVEIKCPDANPIIAKKTSLCWLLGSERPKLSNDRLRRVQHPIKKNVELNRCKQKQNSSKPLYNYTPHKLKKRVCR